MQQLGNYQDAQKIYFNAMQTVHSGNMNSKARLTKAEFELWEGQYVACAQRLCQWDQLTEFSRTVNHTELVSTRRPSMPRATCRACSAPPS